MIVHIEKTNPDGTITRFCEAAIDSNEAKLKLKDVASDNPDCKFRIAAYECGGIITTVANEF